MIHKPQKEACLSFKVLKLLYILTGLQGRNQFPLDLPLAVKVKANTELLNAETKAQSCNPLLSILAKGHA